MTVHVVVPRARIATAVVVMLAMIVSEARRIITSGSTDGTQATGEEATQLLLTSALPAEGARIVATREVIPEVGRGHGIERGLDILRGLRLRVG